MAISAGRIVTVGGLNVIDRLQDSGLQNPRVPTETVRETGNDLVVGKILTEADFTFQMTSWDVSCDMMAMLTGKTGGAAATEGPAAADAAGTEYKWENCTFLNLTCPWKKDSGSEGGHITSGVIIPAFYPTALSYKFGVTANAEQTVSLAGGSYYMSDAVPLTEMAEASSYPIEQITTPAAKATSVETAEPAKVHRIGGFGSEKYRHVFGVLVNGIIQEEGVDYVEEGGANPGAKPTKVKLKFAKEFSGSDIVRLCYFSTTAHAIPQAANATTTVSPAAVRGRDIKVLLGKLPSSGEAKEIEEGLKEHGAEQVILRGVQTFDLNATHTGTVQREMGYPDAIGYNETGIDCNGTITIDPKEEAALYEAIEKMTGIARTEVTGYLNEHNVPLSVAIYNPNKPSEVLKTIIVGDAKFQTPGTAAKVNTTVSLPITFESEQGTFAEKKKQI